MKNLLSPKTEPPRSAIADLELMMWLKGNPCCYEREQTKLPLRFCELVLGFRGPWAGHLSKVGFNATIIIQEERTHKSSEISMHPRKKSSEHLKKIGEIV